MFVTLPMLEDGTHMLLRPYIQAVVLKSNNWLTFSKALLYRSKNEIDRSKTMERSLAQMQALIDQFREQTPPAIEKLDYVFASAYPMSWGIKQELAEQYKKLGVFMSAHELLKSIGMHEEAIRTLFMAGRSG